MIITPQTAPPSSSPIPAPSATAGPITPATPAPSPSPAAGDVLDPNTYAILGDKISGNNTKGGTFDLDGHVNIFYQDGVLGGDHAHYDGQRYIDITGNTFLKNRSGDTVLFADSVRFDEHTQKATLLRGRGESTQGVEQGKLHFSGTSMVTDRAGITHVERANLTTCENPRGGYHLESKTLDVYPGDKAVARSAVLFLGALAVFYLPIAVISLRHEEPGSRRQPGFLPIVGYSSTEGFYVKARIGFSPSDYYYGYYRIEEYTKIGLGPRVRRDAAAQGRPPADRHQLLPDEEQSRRQQQQQPSVSRPGDFLAHLARDARLELHRQLRSARVAAAAVRSDRGASITAPRAATARTTASTARRRERRRRRTTSGSPTTSCSGRSSPTT